jgi:hypothetical protein
MFFLKWTPFSNLKSRTRMDGFSREYPSGACLKAFVGLPRATRPTDQNLHPLIKIDSPIVISIWEHARTRSEILTWTEISASPVYRVYLNRCSRWRGHFCDFFDLYWWFHFSSGTVIVSCTSTGTRLRLTIVLLRPVPLALVLLVNLNHVWRAIKFIRKVNVAVC